MAHSCARLALSFLFLLLATVPASGAGSAAGGPAKPPWAVDLKVHYALGSHTSYEFGNPFPPYQTPLSRLEFPFDTWWGSLGVRRDFSRFSLGIEGRTNLSRRAESLFLDSDWDDEERPEVKTIYSESRCRVEPSYQFQTDVDLKIADWLGLPPAFDLRPLAGFRWQRLSFTAHDGTQYYPAPGENRPPDSLPGDAIAFEQTYRLFFFGLKAAREWKNLPGIGRLKLRLQLDWAYVTADNEDHHLLRAGRRFTYEKTTGDGWHALAGLDMALTERLDATLEWDYLWIKTSGTHRWVNPEFEMNFSSDHGVVVWSQQQSLAVGLRYAF